MPQLIVALDSLNEDANYIHINDVKENTIYYCPCCKSVIKPRAYKQGVDYQMQPHFYHESGGCNEETYIHYICKNWLFDRGVRFLVNEVEYEVNSIETEKTLHTSFGNYRPDIIVTTTDGKTFYFEIKSTNRKTELYAPKWDELGNDVVEVDVRDFINQKVQSDIPVFHLIYSDGECFIKSYTKKDYDEIIAARKIEWKRQDKLNYKIQWERLDWFWETLVCYKRNKNNIEDVLIAFENLDFSDKDFVMTVVKKMKCQELFDSFVSIINKAFWDEIKKIDISPYESVYLKQESPRVFYVGLQICHIQKCRWFVSKYIGKQIKYYGFEILEHIKQLKESEFVMDYNKYCYKEIKQLDLENKLIRKTRVHFYLTDHPSIYVQNKNGLYVLKKSYYSAIGCWSLYKLLETYYNSRYHEMYLCDLITYRPGKKTNIEFHSFRRNYINNESTANQLISPILNLINSCKNNCWEAKFLYDYPKSTIFIYLKTDDGYCNRFYIETNIEKHTKQYLFKHIKKRMSDMLRPDGYTCPIEDVCMNWSDNDWSKYWENYNSMNEADYRIRVVMEDSNGK